jgi:3-phosphoshikimate 1-carboxyvinyltransferase
MTKPLSPSKSIGGELYVPGDKSIAQRGALLSLLSRGPITLRNFPTSADCRTALEAVRQFGVTVTEQENTITLTPPASITVPDDTYINCGNSGTTARLLAGIAAGSPWSIVLTGDESLSRRPMKRIVDPLTAMGAEMFDSDGHLPMTVRGKRLLPFEFTLPVPSAQLKSSLLLAGLASGCSVMVREVIPSRDHTELMINHLGEGVTVREIKAEMTEDPNDPRKRRMVMPAEHKREITLSAQAKIIGGELDIPGDFSTAAFFFALAALSDSTITVHRVGLNPTRTGFLDYLKTLGAKVEISEKATSGGELRGTVRVTGNGIKPRRVAGEVVAGMIDEIPLVAMLAAFAEGTTVIRDAAELRVKESDRLEAVAHNLTLMGVSCGLLEDGLAIEGKHDLSGADFRAFGDHRIAMAFSIAAMRLEGPSTLDDAPVVAVSCPEFFNLLESVTT